MRSDRRPLHTVCQVRVDEQIRPSLPETESLEDIIGKLLPTPSRNALAIEDPRCSSKQQVLHSVYFDLDALASYSDDDLVDVRKCQDLSVTVLYKPEEWDISAKSRMTVSNSVDQLESGAGDVRKVVRHQDEAMNGEMMQPERPRSTHELSAPTVDLVTGKCNPREDD